MHLIESIADVERLSEHIIPKGKSVAVLTQTTLSVQETEDILMALQKRFPTLVLPPQKIFVTPQRIDKKAAQELANQCDVFCGRFETFIQFESFV